MDAQEQEARQLTRNTSISRRPAVAVIGMWHLGLVTAACLANVGYSVVGYDPDDRVIEGLSVGRSPVYEPGLDELIAKSVERDALSFTFDLRSAVGEAEFLIIAIDTPLDNEDNPKLESVYETVFQCANHLRDNRVIILSSQVPIGTSDDLIRRIRTKRKGLKFDLAYVPENLRLGDAIRRFSHPEFLLIGAEGADTVARLRRFYRPIFASPTVLSRKEAELSKHVLNAYLALQVSFANELGRICDELEVDSIPVTDAIKQDPRVGKTAMLRPGMGFSGGTLARDVRTLQRLGKEAGIRTRLLDAVMNVNQTQNDIVEAKIRAALKSSDGAVVAFLGLTYKPGTSTMRRSSALEIARKLARDGIAIRAFDPKAEPIPSGRGRISIFDSPLSAATGADALVISTAWPEFKRLDFSRLKSVMRNPVIVDVQNLLDGKHLSSLGLTHAGIGRGGGFRRRSRSRPS